MQETCRDGLSFQQQRVADEVSEQDEPLHPCQPAVESDSSADQLPVTPDQLHQPTTTSIEQAKNSDEQLQVVHEQYAAALRSDKQQQRQSAHAMPDLHRHLHPQSLQLPPQLHEQLLQQLLQQQQRQHLPKHLPVSNASEPQLLQPQQQQQLEQQQALAAYQAALGRPVVQQTAGSAQGAAQHVLHAQLPDPALKQQQALGTGQQLPAQLPQQLPGQGVRKGQGSVTLPCDVAQAHNVYRAFQWQKDAIGHADACNRQAAGLEAYPGEQGQSLFAYSTVWHCKMQKLADACKTLVCLFLIALGLVTITAAAKSYLCWHFLTVCNPVVAGHQGKSPARVMQAYP